MSEDVKRTVSRDELARNRALLADVRALLAAYERVLDGIVEESKSSPEILIVPVWDDYFAGTSFLFRMDAGLVRYGR